MTGPVRVAAPDRRIWLDLGLLGLLLLVTLAGLAPSYQGWQFLLVGMVGAAVGAGAALLTRALSWPAVSAVVLALVLFYLLGGAVCLHGRGTAALLPDAASARQLTHEALYGWKEMLTTLPPLDVSGPLLVLPFVLGLVGGLAGTLLAGLDRGPAWLGAVAPLLAPLVVLAAVILLGVRRPQSLWLQGVAFAVLALVWLVLRHDRRAGAVRAHGGRLGRNATGAALLVGAAVLALPVGTWAAGGDAHRTVLRSYVDPPFDIGQYPSPLASFRRYVAEPPGRHDPQNLYRQPLFTITGVPAGTRVRIATLDHYDGVIYGASNGSEPGPVDDTFQRVSSAIDDPARGTPVSGTVTLGPGYSGVWLPTVGALQHLDFRHGDTAALSVLPLQPGHVDRGGAQRSGRGRLLELPGGVAGPDAVTARRPGRAVGRHGRRWRLPRLARREVGPGRRVADAAAVRDRRPPEEGREVLRRRQRRGEGLPRRTQPVPAHRRPGRRRLADPGR
jgi:hypothetical protein